jgi:hypothetical protein
MLQEAVKRFHHFDDRDVRAVVDELMICLGGIGPAPRVCESVELRLAYLPAWLAKEDVVIGVGVKRRIEIDQIDTLRRETLSGPKAISNCRRNRADSLDNNKSEQPGSRQSHCRSLRSADAIPPGLSRWRFG